MIEQAVRAAQKAGMEDVVAKLEERQETQIKFHNSDISVIKNWTTRQLSLFMTLDKKILLLTLENPDRDAIHKAITNGKAIIPRLSPKDHYHGIGQQRRAPRSDKRYDASIADTARLVPIAEKTIADATDGADNAAGVLSAGKHHVELASSEDIHAEDDNSWATLSVRAFTDAGGSGHAVRCARTLDRLDTDAGATAARDAARAGDPQQGERGTYDVIFSSLALANLMQHVATFASAFYVDAGMSFLAGETGRQVGSADLTIKDTGSHPDGIASRVFDDEGIATGETTIIEKGQLRSYLHNTSTAHRYDAETTANAGLIVPHPWNVVVDPGDASLEEIISDVEHGLLVTNVWYTRFQNYRTGAFSTIPRDAAIMIENGELNQAVTGIRISDSLPRLLSSIDMFSQERYQIHWWEVETPVFTPAAIVREVPVTHSFR
ncbi:MAG: TldD/PmbA family protein [Thermoplasmatota archaeon]